MASGHRMSEDQVVAQMRTTISAGYETVSAIVAVSSPNIWFQQFLIATISGFYMSLL
jgi:hypothetical protein